MDFDDSMILALDAAHRAEMNSLLKREIGDYINLYMESYPNIARVEVYGDINYNDDGEELEEVCAYVKMGKLLDDGDSDDNDPNFHEECIREDLSSLSRLMQTCPKLGFSRKKVN